MSFWKSSGQSSNGILYQVLRIYCSKVLIMVGMI